jgi:hypothetical protein
MLGLKFVLSCQSDAVTLHTRVVQIADIEKEKKEEASL